MFPFRDENPTVHRIWVTYLLIAANVLVFFFATSTADPAEEQIEFAIDYAAIPCELTEGRPLTLDEIRATFGSETGPTGDCLLYTSPSPRDLSTSRMPSSA